MDFKEIKELIKIFDKSELNKLKLKQGEFEVSLLKGANEVKQQINTNSSYTVPSIPIQAESSQQHTINAQTQTTCIVENNEKICTDTINSPMIGTFYSSPSPQSSPFVKVGDTVKKGQILCILEAMKIMNEVEAESDCRILEILVEDSSPVEYDMPLFAIEKL